jgi:hypothetical protein
MVTQETLDAALQSVLRGKEKVLWSGRPNPRRASLSGITVILFGVGAPMSLFVVWGMLAVARTLGSGGTATAGVIIFGLPFGLVGLTLLSAPYWAYRKAQRTIYAVTSTRVLAVTAWPFANSVHAIEWARIGLTRATERRSGEGDLIIRPLPGASPGGHEPLIFSGILSVRQVEGMVREMATRASDAGARRR